ncbi:MAG TPA: hypothetical protein PLM80_09830 [Mesotoga sp.]|jgi:hypothetical protein|nr:hypothetical protein [Mesotoga sp.]MDI9374564.1 hypothetical protein [Thermotogota bacterium]NLX34310.1 hypothetical protein [Thermotogaceae bacterium]MDD4041059.1 hypothetical protein [Mesotoga sp.]MDD4479638.1 hypothetical protein [Mesotoga sp.]
MTGKVERLESIRRTLAMLLDDVQWKLDDVVLTIGDLIDEEKKLSLDTLKNLGMLKRERRDMLSIYMKAIEDRNEVVKRMVENLWDLPENNLKEALEKLHELLKDE